MFSIITSFVVPSRSRAWPMMWLLICISLVATPAQAEIAIIVNANNTQDIDLDTVMRIYLGLDAKFPSGDEAQALALPDGSRVHGELNLALLKAAPANIKSAWARQQFSGSLKPLTTYNSDEAMLKAVAATPNAIGYVDAARVRGNVRVALKL